MVNLPNLITLVRILLVPVFLLIFWSAHPDRIFLSMSIAALAGITDVLDGYLARKYKLVTTLGKILDPAADKLMVLSVAISLYLIGRFPVWLVLLIIAKEIVLVLGSLFLVFKEKTEVSASVYGKAATFFIYLALFAEAFKIPGSLIFALIAALSSVIALTTYSKNFIQDH